MSKDFMKGLNTGIVFTIVSYFVGKTIAPMSYEIRLFVGVIAIIALIIFTIRVIQGQTHKGDINE